MLKAGHRKFIRLLLFCSLFVRMKSMFIRCYSVRFYLLTNFSAYTGLSKPDFLLVFFLVIVFPDWVLLHVHPSYQLYVTTINTNCSHLIQDLALYCVDFLVFLHLDLHLDWKLCKCVTISSLCHKCRLIIKTMETKEHL